MIYFLDTPEEFLNIKLNCNSWVATAVVGAAAIGGAVKVYTANEAANAQIGATGRATQQQYGAALEGWKQIQTYYGLAQDQLKPYQDFGKTGIDQLDQRLPALTASIPTSQAQRDLQSPLAVSEQQLGLRDALPVSQEQRDLAGPLEMTQEQLNLRNPMQLTQEQLEQIPGYQFTERQGLKATQNAAAARGLGVSGAALKGAASFATGLASEKALAFGAQEMQNRNEAFTRYAATYGQAAAERAAAAGRFGQIFNQEASERQAASAREAAIFGQTAGERNSATSRFQQEWQNTQVDRQSAFDKLMAIISGGANAAGTGAILAQRTGADINKTFTDVGKGVGANTIGAGNAEAAGINAIGGAVAETANNIGGYAAYKGINGNVPGGNPNMTYTKGAAGNMYVPTYGR